MLTELEDSKPINGKSPNYFKFSVTPKLEDNLFMIMKDSSESRTRDHVFHQEETVEIIFEISLN